MPEGAMYTILSLPINNETTGRDTVYDLTKVYPNKFIFIFCKPTMLKTNT
jgi:hypothetical protein